MTTKTLRMDVDEDWASLERLYRTFPSTREQRALWRTTCEEIDARLRRRGHMGLPALMPGLVHARLATALLASGYRAKTELARRSFLCLGCHAGLEVRILRDFGAGRVHGIETHPDVVRVSRMVGLVRSDEVTVEDFWRYLDFSTEIVDAVLVLMPYRISVGTLWQAVQSKLVVGGHLVIVAQSSDVLDVPAGISHGIAMEGTMRWYRMIKA